MIEIIKLANHFNLSGMIRAIESVFTDNMLQLLESNSTFLTIKSISQRSHLGLLNKKDDGGKGLDAMRSYGNENASLSS